MFAVAAATLLGLPAILFNAITDAHFSWLKRDASGTVVVVGIDPPSLAKMGVWPWPRSLHADLIKRLQELGVAEIVFDVDFSARQSPASDDAFRKALDEAQGSVVLPSFVQLVTERGGRFTSHVTMPINEFRARSWPAVANVYADEDGVVRKYPWGAQVGSEYLASMGALLAGTAERKGDFYIDFGIGSASVPSVSYIDILDGTVPKGSLAGKKVIIGATAIELGDRFNVPNGQIIAGPILQALAAETLIQRRELSSTSFFSSASGLLLLVCLIDFMWHRTTGGRRLLMLAGLSLLIELAAVALHSTSSIVLDQSIWQIAIAGYFVAGVIDELDLRKVLARLAEHRFNRFALSVADGLICTDLHGRITYANPAAENIFGFAPRQMIGHEFSSLLAEGQLTLHLSADTVSEADANVGISEFQGRRVSGEVFTLEASVTSWKRDDVFQFGYVLRDISQRKKEEVRIRYIAEHDMMTDLLSRSKLIEILGHTLDPDDSNNGAVALILVGLDGLKELNDSLGQDRGDLAICAFAARLRRFCQSEAAVARLNGDEFAVLVTRPDVEEVRQQIVRVVNEFSKICLDLGDGDAITVTTSSASAVYPFDAMGAGELLANAALALQEAKIHRRGGHVGYRAQIRDVLEAKRLIEADLKSAFADNQFELYYQPQFDVSTRTLVGAEALIRWNHPQKGIVSPAHFLPVLNTMPLASAVGSWVIEKACHQAAEWERAGKRVRIGINLCPALFSTDLLPDVVDHAIDSSGLSPDLIELEITEDILLLDGSDIALALNKMRDRGVGIAFDDFGTGHASLTHLKSYPIDRIKVDQSFVRNMLSNANDRAIVGAIVGLAKLLGLEVIAEGVEDNETIAELNAIGCHEAQGFWLGRPVPAVNFMTMHLKGETTCTAA